MMNLHSGVNDEAADLVLIHLSQEISAKKQGRKSLEPLQEQASYQPSQKRRDASQTNALASLRLRVFALNSADYSVTVSCDTIPCAAWDDMSPARSGRKQMTVYSPAGKSHVT